MTRHKCARCARFGAREFVVSGARLPRTPAENWAYAQSVLACSEYGDYGEVVRVGRMRGRETFSVPLCSSCAQQELLVVGGKVSRCDRCGSRRYGAGSELHHLCEDCLLAEVGRWDDW
jgi:hypothetical protein